METSILSTLCSETLKQNAYILSSVIPLTEEFFLQSYGFMALIIGYVLAALSTLLIR